MIDGHTLAKIKSVYFSAYRAVVNMVESSRTGRAALAALRATGRSFGHVLHQLWLEVTGFTFLAMAGVWPCDRAGAAATRNMLHDFLCVVRVELVLAGK